MAITNATILMENGTITPSDVTDFLNGNGTIYCSYNTDGGSISVRETGDKTISKVKLYSTNTGSRVVWAQDSSSGWFQTTVSKTGDYYYYEPSQTHKKDTLIAFRPANSRTETISQLDIEYTDGTVESTAGYSVTINPTPQDADVRFEVGGSIVTEDVYNITTVGTLTNNNGVLSGFSTSKYATAPVTFSPSSNSWEIGVKVTTGSTLSGTNTIFEQTANQFFGIRLCRSSDSGVLFLDIATSSSSNHVMFGTTVLQTNTSYWIKCTYDGTAYKMFLSLDGETYTQEMSTTLGPKIDASTPFYIGYYHNPADAARVWPGSIDLNYFYIKIADELVWQGVTTTYPNPVTVEENTSVTYTVSKEGYITQSDTVTVNANTVLNVVLSKPSSINLGSTPIHKIC